MVKHGPSTSDAASTSLETSHSDADLSGGVTPSPDPDAVFAALGHRRRRHLLSSLVDGDCEQSLTRLATDVVARENDQPRENVSTEARQRCRIALHHAHLPKLTALGIVDSDPDGEPTVRAADIDQVEAVLSAVGGELDTSPETVIQRDGA